MRHVSRWLVLGLVSVALILPGRLIRAQNVPIVDLVFRSANSLPNENDYATLFQVNVETGETTRFLDNDHTYVVNMAWSPDGTLLAGLVLHQFSKDQTQSPFDVCIFNMQGKEEACFREVAAHHSDSQSSRPLGWPLHWTQDNDSILFVSQYGDGSLSVSAAHLRDQTTELVQEFEWDNFAFIRDFAWRPDGTQFAISIELNDPIVDVVQLIDVSTQEIVEFRGDSEYTERPAWSTDGRYLAYVSSSLMIYDTQTGVTEQPGIASGSYRVAGSLSWSHSGHQLAFWGHNAEYNPTGPDEIEPPQLYLYDMDSESLQTIVQPFSVFHYPIAWAPDDILFAFEASVEPNLSSEIVVLSPDGQSYTFLGEGSSNEEPVWRLNKPIK